MKIPTRAMVNWKRVFSSPRRVRNELSAEPKSPEPWPRTCMSTTTTKTTATIICITLRRVVLKPLAIQSAALGRQGHPDPLPLWTMVAMIQRLELASERLQAAFLSPGPAHYDCPSGLEAIPGASGGGLRLRLG